MHSKLKFMVRNRSGAERERQRQRGRATAVALCGLLFRSRRGWGGGSRVDMQFALDEGERSGKRLRS